MFSESSLRRKKKKININGSEENAKKNSLERIVKVLDYNVLWQPSVDFIELEFVFRSEQIDVRTLITEYSH